MVNNAESLPEVIAGQVGARGKADLGSANLTLADNPNPMLPLSVLGALGQGDRNRKRVDFIRRA